ncbi:MAG: PKD domain-containing protein [Thermodesulfobacteriota bacterium]|nr:PKD domain-containing protein [Thermodesulfobacteriota bacterium]
MNGVKKSRTCAVTLLFTIGFILLSSTVCAEEDFIVTIGENKVFTAYNYDYTRIWNQYGSIIETSTDGQTASAHVFCDDGEPTTCQEGRAFIGAGVTFQTREGPGQKTYADATISITFSYATEVDFKPELGSANVWIDLRPSYVEEVEWILCGQSVLIGAIQFHEESGHDSKNDTVTLISNYPLFAGRTYGITANPYIGLHACGDGAEARAEVTIHEIKVLFTPENEEPHRPIAIFDYAPSDPEVGESVDFISTSYDPDNDPLTYFWSVRDNSDGSTLETFETEGFSYIFTKEGAYTVTLMASDGVFTDETSQTVGLTIPEPTVTPCTTDSSVEMHQEYCRCYNIKNNAKVPIVVNFNIEESRENITQTLLWNPFSIDLELKRLTTEVVIPAEQTQRLWFPDDDYYVHQWYWINNESWWMNNLQYAIGLFDILYTNEFDAIDQALEAMEEAFSRMQVNKLETVEYLLKGRGSWWHDDSLATYDLSIPDVNITAHVPKNKQDYFEQMLVATSRGLRASQIASLLMGPDLFSMIRASAFAIIEAAALTKSAHCYEEALDPPDDDYAVLVEPQAISWPEINDIPENAPSKPFLSKMLETLSLQKAHARSLFKYEGAAVAGDANWEALQMEQVYKYSRMMRETYAEALVLFQELAPNLPEIRPEMIEKGKQILINEGLPEVEKNILSRELGFGPADFDKLTAALLSPDNLWPTSYSVLRNLLLISIIQANDAAFRELEAFISIRMTKLGEPILQPSSEDLEILEGMKTDIEQLMALGNCSEGLLRKIEVLSNRYEELLIRTNNYPALEIYDQTLKNAFSSLQADAFTSIPGTCSYLGDDPRPLAPDMDVFRFSGTAGETVTVTLESSPPEYGAGKRAVLIMRNLGRGLRLFKRLNDRLPLEMTVTLPIAGEYHVKVMEAPGRAVIWGEKYEGDYCVTLEASPETMGTLVPDLDVE